MKRKKENMNVRELFRSKLENSEVIPSDAVREKLMRSLALKKFVRFNPSRFNIYYLGGIAVIVVATVLILNSGQSGESTGENQNIAAITPSQGEVSFSDRGNVINTDKPVVSNVTEKNPSGRKPVMKSEQTVNRKEPGNRSVEVIRDSSDVDNGLLKKQGVSNADIQGKINQVGLQKRTEAAFDVSSSNGCSPLKVKFRNKSVSYDSCRWVFGDGGFSDEKNPEWIFDVAGEYKIVLKVFNTNGAQESATSIITVYPKPSARFEIYPEKPVIPDDEIHFVNYSVDAEKYKWDFGDGNTSNSYEPFHKYRKFSTYNVRLIALSDFGCPDTLLVKNAFSVSGCFIDFPNAFIPGTDGPSGGYYSARTDESSRIFHPVTSGVNEYHLKIFSKLGILIFESNDINIGWDGYLKGQLCEPGVYVWKVRGTYKNGEPFVKMGDITLLKN